MLCAVPVYLASFFQQLVCDMVFWKLFTSHLKKKLLSFSLSLKVSLQIFLLSKKIY